MMAWLLDLDGTLVLTEEAHFEVHAEVLADRGLLLLEELKDQAIGTNDDLGFYRMLANAQGRQPSDEELLSWTVDKMERTARSFASQSIQQISGAAAFIDWLRSSQRKWGVVTSTKRDLAKIVWRQAGFGPEPDAFVCYEDTSHRKPDPSPYLLAAQQLAVEPSDCAIIEDSFPGIEAGRRACAAEVWAMATSHDATALREAGADHIVTSFAEVPRDD